MKKVDDLIKEEYLGKEAISEYPDGRPYYYGREIDFTYPPEFSKNPDHYSDFEVGQMAPIGVDSNGEPVYFGEGDRQLYSNEMELDLKDGSYEKEVYKIVTLSEDDTSLFLSDEKMVEKYVSDRLAGLSHVESLEKVQFEFGQYNIDKTGVDFLEKLVGNTHASDQHWHNRDEFKAGLDKIHIIDQEVSKEQSRLKNIFRGSRYKIESAVSNANKQFDSYDQDQYTFTDEINDIVRQVISRQKVEKKALLNRLNNKMLVAKNREINRKRPMGWIENKLSDKEILFTHPSVQGVEILYNDTTKVFTPYFRREAFEKESKTKFKDVETYIKNHIKKIPMEKTVRLTRKKEKYNWDVSFITHSCKVNVEMNGRGLKEVVLTAYGLSNSNIKFDDVKQIEVLYDESLHDIVENQSVSVTRFDLQREDIKTDRMLLNNEFGPEIDYKISKSLEKDLDKSYSL